MAPRQRNPGQGACRRLRAPGVKDRVRMRSQAEGISVLAAVAHALEMWLNAEKVTLNGSEEALNG